MEYTRFKNKVTFADINIVPSFKHSQFSSLITFFCTVISSGVGTLLAVGEYSIIQVVNMASDTAEHGGICGPKEPCPRREIVVQLQGITDNILIICTEIGVKTTHTDISEVSNSKNRKTMQSVDEAVQRNMTYISPNNLTK